MNGQKESNNDIIGLKRLRCCSAVRPQENSEEHSSWIAESLNFPENGKKDYSITTIESDLLKQIEEKVKNKDSRGSYARKQIAELLKRCPYMDQLRKTSEKYRAVLLMLETLARYNELLKKLIENNIVAKTEDELERFNELFKKNRCLRIDIKCQLCETNENQMKIEKMKQSMNVFGIHPRTNKNSCIEKTSKTKRELIKFRDYLMQENDKFVYKLKRKLV